jgi:REP element-mobilizing transposase RayT
MEGSVRFDPRVHHRRSIRLKGFDYAQPGAYFVTVCAWRRNALFGRIAGGRARLNALGRIVAEEWVRTERVRPEVSVDAFVVMPDHVHGIIVITERNPRARDGRDQTRSGPGPGSLGAIVGQFKTAAARRINALRQTPGQPVWQRGFYERIVRDPAALDNIRRYIADNPIRW